MNLTFSFPAKTKRNHSRLAPGMFSCATLMTTPAFAEVCDKVRPDWNSKQFTAWDELVYFLSQPIVIVFLCLWILAWYSQKRWAAYAVAIPLGLLMQFRTIDYVSSSALASVTLEAIQEGCLGSIEYVVAFVSFAIVLLVGRTYWKT